MRIKGEPFELSIGGSTKSITHEGARYSAVYEIDGPHVLVSPGAAICSSSGSASVTCAVWGHPHDALPSQTLEVQTAPDHERRIFSDRGSRRSCPPCLKRTFGRPSANPGDLY
jgi:hypothetical protein